MRAVIDRGYGHHISMILKLIDEIDLPKVFEQQVGAVLRRSPNTIQDIGLEKIISLQ